MSENVELKLAGGGVIRACVVCGTAFAAYRNAHGTEQKRCPRCCDLGLHPRKDGSGTWTRGREVRPSAVVDRRQVTFIDGVQIASLPGEWQRVETQERDTPSYKIDVPGRVFGKAWNGRLLIYADRPWEVGDIVAVRVMVAVHEVRATYDSRPTSGFTQLKGGPSVVTRRTVHPLAGDVGEVEREERPYIVLEATRVPQIHGRELVYVVARTKTTLKGFGRQIYSRIEGDALWHENVHGGLRSGRAYYDAMLAVLDAEHRLEVVTHEEPGLKREDVAEMRMVSPDDVPNDERPSDAM